MMTEMDIAAVQQAAEDAENRRRLVASQTPGHGAAVPTEQPASGPSTGKYGVAGPVVGEGYDVTAEIASAVQKAYGPDRPVYADDSVGGYNFAAGRQEAPIRRSVTDLGDGRLFIDGASAPAGDGLTVLSPPAPVRPGLLARIRSRLRRG